MVGNPLGELIYDELGGAIFRVPDGGPGRILVGASKPRRDRIADWPVNLRGYRALAAIRATIVFATLSP
jgi:hypothetical protein